MRSDQGAAPEGARDDAIRLTPPAGTRRALRWSRVLTAFMRMLALLWMAKGLSYWALIVGAGYLPAAFEARPLGFQATSIYFAVIDLVAAVGLWLTSTWGGVMWLLAIMSHLILTVFFPGIVTSDWVTIGLFCGLVALYLLLSHLAARNAE